MGYSVKITPTCAGVYNCGLPVKEWGPSEGGMWDAAGMEAARVEADKLAREYLEADRVNMDLVWQQPIEYEIGD